ncbi:zinc finger protein 62 homolog isoform X13 [Anopheles darlingi]|uniref:zinc finger protein 62 homolog isoform X13 n=1 Tax=Anopheles darlingi TaxID=43151 RepID=UPI00210008E1|nr:zinc finger protein 62 homolog isoform X13 [Anopheles darlingi]
MEVLGEINSFCRFCLSQDCELLMPLSSAIEDLSFSIQDIQQTTGVLILESEIDCLTVCTKCSTSIELAVDFRRSCINGNILFMQLFGHIIDKLRSPVIAEEKLENATYRNNDPLRIEIMLQNVPNNENIIKADNKSAWSVEKSQELFDERTSNGQEDCEDVLSRPDLLTVPRNTIILKRKITNKRVAATASNQRMTKSKVQIAGNEEHTEMKRKKSGKHIKRLCGICGALVTNLITHTRSHTKENLLKCPHCPVQMAHPTNLLRHVNTVHEKKIIKSCEPCGKGFTTYDAYNSHMRSQHNIGKQHQCEICLKMFKRATSRRDHIQRMHIAEWKYECQICQKKFKDKSGLRGHARVHSTNAPYACSHCSKRFKSSFAKKTHEITHSGIDFPCTLCTKVYRYKSLLSMHYRKCHPEECNSELA